MKRYLIRIMLPLMLIGLLLGHTGGYLHLSYIDEIDKLLYDTRLRYTAPGGVDGRVVIVAIDETSLEAEGHWPWTRDKLSRLLDRLTAHGVAAVGFDMVFAERDMSADVRLLRQMASDPEDDAFNQLESTHRLINSNVQTLRNGDPASDLPASPPEVSPQMAALAATWNMVGSNAQTIISSEALVKNLGLLMRVGISAISWPFATEE